MYRLPGGAREPETIDFGRGGDRPGECHVARDRLVIDSAAAVANQQDLVDELLLEIGGSQIAAWRRARVPLWQAGQRRGQCLERAERIAGLEALEGTFDQALVY